MQAFTEAQPKAVKTKRDLKVLCLGMSRTGTISLRAAFATLGYTNTYHFSTPALEEPSHASFWIHAFKKKFEQHGTVTRDEFDQVYSNYECVTDAPSAFFWKELLQAYPDAKVVLQTRPLESWFKSHMNNIWPFSWEFYGHPRGLNPYWWLFRLLQPTGDFWEFSALTAEYGHGIKSEEQVRKRYVEHNDAVRTYLKQTGRPYLEYDVAQGWKPLCNFLEKDIPKDQEFPRLNDTKSFQEGWDPFLGGIRREIHKKMLFVVLGLLGGLSAATWAYTNA